MNTPPALSHTLDPSGYVRARRERVRERSSPADAPQAGAEAPPGEDVPGEGHPNPRLGGIGWVPRGYEATVTSSGGNRWSDPCPEQRRC